MDAISLNPFSLHFLDFFVCLFTKSMLIGGAGLTKLEV